MKLFWLICLAWNIVVFGLYGLDKYLAKHRMLRIPELVLLVIPFAFGGVGAFAGMKFFHHKTRKMEFNILVPASIVVDYLLYYLLTHL